MTDQAGLTPGQMALRALAVKALVSSNPDDRHKLASHMAKDQTAILALLDDVTTATARLAEVGMVVAARDARIEELESDLVATKEETEKWRGAARVLCGAHVGVPQTTCPVCALTAARARIEALEAALQKYGDHDGSCATRWAWQPEKRTCDCGYSAALEPPATGHDAGGEVDWQPIGTAPKDNPNRDIEVRRDGQTWIAHWHTGAPDDFQPPVPAGWYYRDGDGYREVWPAPTEWREPHPTEAGRR